jgi:hypothetical protein
VKERVLPLPDPERRVEIAASEVDHPPVFTGQVFLRERERFLFLEPHVFPLKFGVGPGRQKSQFRRAAALVAQQRALTVGSVGARGVGRQPVEQRRRLRNTRPSNAKQVFVFLRVVAIGDSSMWRSSR